MIDYEAPFSYSDPDDDLGIASPVGWHLLTYEQRYQTDKFIQEHPQKLGCRYVPMALYNEATVQVSAGIWDTEDRVFVGAITF